MAKQAPQHADDLRAEWFWVDRWMMSRAFMLPMEARGIYREMLSQAWLRGAELPNDPDQVRRAIGASDDEWARSWPKVQPFWRIDGDRLVNEIQQEIYAKCLAKRQANIDRARLGAEARWGQKRASGTARASSQAMPEAMPEAMLKHREASSTVDAQASSSVPGNASDDACGDAQAYAQALNKHENMLGQVLKHMPKQSVEHCPLGSSTSSSNQRTIGGGGGRADVRDDLVDVGPGIRTSGASSGLVMSPLEYERQLRIFAYIGSRLRVPRALHRDFVAALGGTTPEEDLQAWYAALDDEVCRTREPIPDRFEFLRPRFTEWAKGRAAAQAVDTQHDADRQAAERDARWEVERQRILDEAEAQHLDVDTLKTRLHEAKMATYGAHL